MIARHWNVRLVRLTILAAALLAPVCLAGPARADGLDKLDTSLGLIPEDAAFYASMLRNREQFDVVRKSNAWAKVQAMPVVQMGLAMYQTQLAVPGSGPAKLQAALENPEIRKIVDLAADMVGDEVFMYGDESCADFLELLQTINTAQSYGPLVMHAMHQAGATEGLDPSKFQAAAMLSALADDTDLIVVPNVVVGFKLKSTDLAKEQLIKLEMFGNLLEVNEKTKGRFKKTKVGEHDYLVLSLDGGMVPWDQIPMDKYKEYEAEEGDAQEVIDRLKELELVLAVGVRGNYLLCSIGSSLECLENLGKGDTLIVRDELKPLAKFADKRLTSIAYLSEDLCEQMNSSEKNIEELQGLAEKLLPLAKLSDQQNERIREDVAALAQDAKDLLPKPGARMSLSFLCDRGVESYQYCWGDPGWIDGSKPLGLLRHVGGNPILGVVTRMKFTVGDYDRLVKWVKTGYGYFEEFGLPNMPESEREKAKKFLAAALPLFERLDKVNREMKLPALADGQFALVIDGKLTSKRFLACLPETEKPMPMIEPAVVRSVSDAKLLKQALGKYRTLINELIDAVRQIEGANVPADIQIPEPQTSEGPLGTIYSFTLPKEWGVDEKIAPTIGVSDDTAVLAISRDHVERLLKATPPAIGGVLKKSDRPLAAAAWFNWAALVTTATPWVDFAIEQAAVAKDLGEEQQKPIAQQVHTGLEVIQVLRSITGETYLEDGALVSHTLTEIRDVEK